MREDEARQRAIGRIQTMIDKGRSREEITSTVYEGAIFPDRQFGYLLAGGRISIPGVCRHGDPGSYCFPVKVLFAEIDSPQGGLFNG